MGNKVNWGIIGTDGTAADFAKGLAEAQTGKLLAVGSRTPGAADRFGAIWQAPHRYGSYDQVLADQEVQAVYLAVPCPERAEWAIKTAEAGKHILCEKPLGLNQWETMASIEVARSHDVFLMEAFLYRFLPQTTKLVELIRSGIIGKVCTIQVSASSLANDTNGQHLTHELGAGSILDVGSDGVSIARLLAGVASGKDFAEPVKVTGAAHIGETIRIDDYAAATLTFPNNIIAQLLVSTSLKTENVVRILGTEGSILVPAPWNAGPREDARILVNTYHNDETQELVIKHDKGGYATAVNTVTAYIDKREALAMRWEDTLGNQRTLDTWRSTLNLVYDMERPQARGQHLPINKRPLQKRSDCIMKYGSIAGVDKPISRLVMGVDNQLIWPQTAVMLDDYFERGGNSFDTAYTYGRGFYAQLDRDGCEKMLGHWIKNRGIREQVVIIDKGAQTPYCNPKALTQQLLESLERLQTDYVDIYMMHRDNPDIPVGEFISVLNEHKNAGRMHVFGVSNWSIERIEEANAWAEAHGLVGITAVSNNFSLARMVNPVWMGCVAASDPLSRAWFTRTQTPLMPWSSQARGFFTGRASPDDHSDPELVWGWYSEDNFRRLERVNQMAQERKVLPINIALAYVLYQPFPTFPLIGPRQVSETRTSFQALTIELTPEELRWLNLEDE